MVDLVVGIDSLMLGDFYWLIALLMVSVVGGKLFAPIIIWLFHKLSSRTKSTLDDRILDAVKGPLESFFFLFVLVALGHSFEFFKFSIQFMDQYLSAAIIVVAAYLVIKIEHAFFKWYFEEGQKTSGIKIEVSFLPLLQKITDLVVIVLALTMFMAEIGFDVSAILAITSIVGIIMGLASQETLANVFAGLALQLDRPYNYGDYIKLTTGEIVRLRKIGLRSTKMIDLGGNMMIISNSEFAKQRVTRIGSQYQKAEILIPFNAPAGFDCDSIVKEVSQKLSAAKPDGLGDLSKLRVERGTIGPLGWFEANLRIELTDRSHTVPVTKLVNEIINDLVAKKSLEQ